MVLFLYFYILHTPIIILSCIEIDVLYIVPLHGSLTSVCRLPP